MIISDMLEYWPMSFILISFFVPLILYKSMKIGMLYLIFTLIILIIGIIIRYFMDISVRQLYQEETFWKFILDTFKKLANREPFY